MAKDMLDKMEMPKKPGEDDGMLAFDEGDMGMEGEAQAGMMDLSGIPDDELLAEIQKRGLMPGQEEPDMSMAEEVDMEEAEA